MTNHPFLTDIKTLRERARRHIEQGAVTEGYTADRENVIDVLNEALATEIVCTLRYKSHYFRANGIKASVAAAEFLEHAEEEQDHADWLAERIVQLGGKPNFSPDGLPGVAEQFRKGAENARKAGFDGVEIHAANGYLLDQFIRSGSNRREDEYGGSVENRLRFPMMVVEAVKQAWPQERIGIRVSPTGSFNDMYDEDPVATYEAFAHKTQEAGLAYIEVVEDSFQGNLASGRPEPVIQAIHEAFRGSYIGNGDYSREEAVERIRAGRCDLVSFGRLIIANPDLVERFKRNAPLNDWDESTFYGGDEHGYTDYPTLEDTK
ncbi:MAG: ferritin-like domain-containing protein [Xanthomonadales bacterium]|nr:ferritin-like domain-containing protein [Xanthomonadales bacterium]